MAHVFKIKLVSGEFVTTEPTVGRWYAAATEDLDGFVSHGALGAYTGTGEFADEGEFVTDEMSECDFLQEQR